MNKLNLYEIELNFIQDYKLNQTFIEVFKGTKDELMQYLIKFFIPQHKEKMNFDELEPSLIEVLSHKVNVIDNIVVRNYDSKEEIIHLDLCNEYIISKEYAKNLSYESVKSIYKSYLLATIEKDSDRKYSLLNKFLNEKKVSNEWYDVHQLEHLVNLDYNFFYNTDHLSVIFSDNVKKELIKLDSNLKNEYFSYDSNCINKLKRAKRVSEIEVNGVKYEYIQNITLDKNDNFEIFLTVTNTINDESIKLIVGKDVERIDEENINKAILNYFEQNYDEKNFEFINLAISKIDKWFHEEYHNEYDGDEDYYKSDFKDLKLVPLAYTYDDYGNDVQAYADIIGCRIIKEVNENIVYDTSYTQEDYLNILDNLDFNELTFVEDCELYEEFMTKSKKEKGFGEVK